MHEIMFREERNRRPLFLLYLPPSTRRLRVRLVRYENNEDTRRAVAYALLDAERRVQYFLYDLAACVSVLYPPQGRAKVVLHRDDRPLFVDPPDGRKLTSSESN